MQKQNAFDIIIIGGGIIGMATALELQQRTSGVKILVLEKESRVASHQSGHNSGVAHAGVYYKPDSLKARFCREGLAQTIAFCREYQIAFEVCGKLIVATNDVELAQMQQIYNRAKTNQIAIEELNASDAKRLEPNITSVGALLSPATGIVDFAEITQVMARLFTGRGGHLRTGVEVKSGIETDQQIHLKTSAGDFFCEQLVACAGLLSDRLARALGAEPEFRIIPFRGEFFKLLNQPPNLVRHLIYPVPDPKHPFLGIHITRKIGGAFTVGPNAVLAFSREGYRLRNINLRDLLQLGVDPAFWKLIVRHAGSASSELASSLSRRHYLQRVQTYCPRIRLLDLSPAAAGVRAQAVSNDGQLIDDFLFIRSNRCLHVCNAPSPAATAAMPIAQHIADTLSQSAKF